MNPFSRTGPSTAAAHVMIADDDPMFRKILESWLKKWGYRVTVVEDGAEAWDRLQRFDAPRLLVLDWMMPKISGVELCSLIRSLPDTHACYILMTTSKNLTEDLIQGLEAGADDYLMKPFDQDQLYARLEEAKRMMAA